MTDYQPNWWPFGGVEPSDPLSTTMVSIGGEMMTEAQFDAARAPLLDRVSALQDAVARIDRIMQIWQSKGVADHYTTFGNAAAVLALRAMQGAEQPLPFQEPST